MAKTGLEERLEAISREFVQRIVAEIRSASFAEVAGYGPAGAASSPSSPHAERASSSSPARKATRVVASPKRAATPASGGSGERQTAEKRAELGERVLETLRTMGTAMNARALANELGVSPEILVTPLLELRQAGRIAKHGEKRATTYTLP